MIGIVNYGMGNLRSVQKALQSFGFDAHYVDRPDQIASCEKLILPGVGAFADAMTNLREAGMIEPLLDYLAADRPFLGICLGLQLLFEVSEEGGIHEGLCVLPGRVVPFKPTDPSMKVPHMGWNALHWRDADHPLFHDLQPGCQCYFVHSYYAEPADAEMIAATTDYGGEFCCSVRRGNCFAMQFHPEKSQKVGLTMLRNFAEYSATR